MSITWQSAVAIIGAITGIIGLVSSWRTSKAAARKDEVEALRGIIAELRADNDELRDEVDGLRGRIKSLETENQTLRSDNQELVKQISKQATEAC